MSTALDEEAAEARLQALRVAKSELQTSSGPVHVQLSKGGVFFMEDRSDVRRKVDDEIRDIVSKLPPSSVAKTPSPSSSR
mmetsp:Transcript_32539/g.71418  ORF Transcript_32539/g.71418 Transcript_32539/m.71418 type:complete len:80 (+) Transcript_32539:100-339(+)|eukprot:CAMPEP_0178524932 /NCGR_PEP_ID=MMETSP0696-20121128/29905_1 /TAXON_ID=265572 /ORGANISM="Extubocellulus spinifer, Strain CCMP396" /LENGTH=79 /DNA_ID=CAMNT_0020156297 /DNA_START=72 /DNA_END=311 /DNA_ORIENTATION=-